MKADLVHRLALLDGSRCLCAGYSRKTAHAHAIREEYRAAATEEAPELTADTLNRF